jgi:hypothetical protein
MPNQALQQTPPQWVCGMVVLSRAAGLLSWLFGSLSLEAAQMLSLSDTCI